MKTLITFLISLFFLLNVESQAQYWEHGGSNLTSGPEDLGTLSSDPLPFITGGNEWMRLLLTGELGLGTSIPNAWFHIYSDSEKETFRTEVNTSTDNYWRMYRNGTEYARLYHLAAGSAFYIHAPRGNLRMGSGNGGTNIPAFQVVGGSAGNAGFAGIGDYTAFTPDRQFEVFRNANAPQFRISYVDEVSGTTGGTWTDFQTTSSGNLVIRPVVANGTGNTEKNVGINVATPLAKFHIQGDASIPSFRITNSTSNDLVNIDDNTQFTFYSYRTNGLNGAFDFETAPPEDVVLGIYSHSVSMDNNELNNTAGWFYADDAGNSGNSVQTIIGMHGLAKSGHTIDAADPWYVNIIGVKGSAESLDDQQIVEGGRFIGTGIGFYNYGVTAHGYGASECNVGVSGAAHDAPNSAIGVWGATDAVGPMEIGVRGEALGSAGIGYGVFGSVTNEDCDDDPSGCSRVAIFSNGAMYATSSYFSSDAQFKQNVSPIQNASYLLAQLQPKTYDFDKVGFPSMHLPSGQQFGFIAQDLEPVLPSTVKNLINPEITDSLGNTVYDAISFKAVNYNAIIPILTAALQEQKLRIDSLVNVLNGVPRNGEQNIDQERGQRVELRDVASVILNQNDPNPFTESTRITYVIPQEVANAKIIFTNSTGMIINTIQIKDRGFSELNVFSSELGTGIYTYTLICDGKIVDSKKMIKQ